jgi:hypothetical protein
MARSGAAVTKYTIYVIDQMFAPARMRYAAAFHPLDEGNSWPSGEGATEEAAIADLVLNYDLEAS